jgi:hypothetical protein
MQPTRPSASNVAIEADVANEAYKANKANEAFGEVHSSTT